MSHSVGTLTAIWWEADHLLHKFERQIALLHIYYMMLDILYISIIIASTRYI